MIEIKGERGESILFDGASVSKFRHDGKEEVARNPVSTYREVRVKPKKMKKRDVEQRYDILLACIDLLTDDCGVGEAEAGRTRHRNRTYRSGLVNGP